MRSLTSPRRPAPLSRRAVGLAAFAAAALIGGAAVWHFAAADLTLSHYDARGHLIVARRTADSLTPGWRQIGAVWLPLPHLLNLVPVQIDWAYRTGASAIAISVLALAWGLASVAQLLFRRTGSATAAIVAPLTILFNPNVLYLQSTPMTEPLLIGLSLVAAHAVDRWAHEPTRRGTGWLAVVLAALVLTRYEGWFVAAALIAIAAIAARRHGWRVALAPATGPIVAIAGFLVLGWATTGSWFQSSGFFVPDNPARHQPIAALGQVLEGLADLAGLPLLVTAGAGLVLLAWRARESVAALVPVALVAAACLPAYAFYQGHPLRIRYMVPLVAAAGTLAACALVAVPARWRGVAAAALVGASLYARPPLMSNAPMLLEAQWDVPNRRARAAVTDYLRVHHDGTPILASMGSLGHYMHEAAAGGLTLRDFLHEGNGDLWAAATARPGRLVRWMLIEERAEGGDMLYQRAQREPALLAGFNRVAEGGGLTLYRRVE